MRSIVLRVHDDHDQALYYARIRSAWTDAGCVFDHVGGAQRLILSQDAATVVDSSTFSNVYYQRVGQTGVRVQDAVLSVTGSTASLVVQVRILPTLSKRMCPDVYHWQRIRT